MEVANGIFYVGVNDKKIDLFEGQFKVEKGMAYNSYVIIDDKIAVMDSVDKNFGDEWLNNVKQVLGNRLPDYLIVQHMEPDHSANIDKFLNIYKNAKVVASSKAFMMMKYFFGTDFEDRKIEVKEGDKINLGHHELMFISAPMVHWPEVILTYELSTNTLFSADAFGKFGALDADEDWACEARRYYFGIVGKYGVQVQALLKKASNLKIMQICPLHGPILNENLEYYFNLYNIWSSYGVESEGVVINYTSCYGHTQEAVNLLANELKENGFKKVVLNDLARCDEFEAIEDTFRYGKVVFATTTYNGDIFPFMKTFIDALVERNFANRQVAFIENGAWAPVAAKIMQTKLEKCRNLSFCNTIIHIKGTVDENSKLEIKKLAEELKA